MLAAGFQYTGDSDTARCEHCGLEAFNWTAEMNPFSIHSVESPHCSYVRSMKSSSLLVVRESFLSSTIVGQNTSISDEQENSFKRRKIDLKSRLNNLFEPDSLQQYRRHSFDDWPHHGILSSGYMIQAGFISCATGDQSVCPYCDLICEQWTPYVDNPSEVHKTLSPACLYVIEKLRLAEPPPIINGSTSSVTASVSNPIHASNNTHSPLLSTFARPVVQNQNRSANHTLVTSTPACPVDKSLSIEELIQANTTSMVDQSDVNKFCCKDLLEHWDPDDDSKVEDDRWFPHWANGKQLYGNELYRKIQKTTRKHQQLRAHLKRENEKVNPDVTKNTNPNPNSRQLFMSSKRLLSIVRRCWQRQSQGRHERSVCYGDLLIARFIQQKQTELRENIIIPSAKMKQISEEAIKRHQKIDGQRQISVESCVVCLVEERRLACMPCGHLTTCVPCGHSLISCPLCRREIEKLVSIRVNV
ncbi:unnamed protein product [Rotaria sp. Silwood2]|nr:unnamed protein product [Rotaria sp. Silwood2]CAF3356249.1 unnamed protein product [Rotaria sp. Silwood2]CAF4382773.1 unnamed protein product [Rotaria sp. Silwood2]CAF4547482.1 unnamed protein product [Rotaria sp. Silwood2]CAF4664054.1 unnamed protein product [Rotaria sp. Silwood2]